MVDREKPGETRDRFTPVATFTRFPLPVSLVLGQGGLRVESRMGASTDA